MSTKNKSQLQLQLQQLQQKKAELLQKKTEAPSKFTKDWQDELAKVTEQIIDLEEQIELEGDEQNTGYKPAPGTENLIHAKITRGHRFDENTGKEISVPYVQMFTYGEFKNFKEKASLIGYTYEVLYNPYKK